MNHSQHNQPNKPHIRIPRSMSIEEKVLRDFTAWLSKQFNDKPSIEDLNASITTYITEQQKGKAL